MSTAAVQELLQRYDAQPDLLLLRDAGEQLDRIDLFAPRSAEARGAARLALLQTWLQVLRRLDAAHDAGFNPDPMPALKLAPRAAPGQPVYAPGTDPATVTDAQQRSDYERDLAANAQQRERAARHWAWRATDTELTDRARRFIGRFYSTSMADRGELHEALTQAGSGAQRQHRLLAPAASP